MYNLIFTFINIIVKVINCVIEFPIKIWSQITKTIVLYAIILFAVFNLYYLLFDSFVPDILGFKYQIDDLSDANDKIRLIFFILFCFVVAPYYCSWEETLFRKGNNDWASIIPVSIVYGLTRAFLNIPLACALSMIVVGFVIHLRYKIVYEQSIILNISQDEAENLAIMQTTILNNMFCNIILFGALLGVIF